MGNSKKIEAINFYQTLNFLHSLTCGNDSGHADLVAKENDGNVVLICKDCDYVQTNVPAFAIETGQHYLDLYNAVDCPNCKKEKGLDKDFCIRGPFSFAFDGKSCPKKEQK